jgi:hypothetical protein
LLPSTPSLAYLLQLHGKNAGANPYDQDDAEPHQDVIPINVRHPIFHREERGLFFFLNLCLNLLLLLSRGRTGLGDYGG